MTRFLVRLVVLTHLLDDASRLILLIKSKKVAASANSETDRAISITV